LLYIFGRRLGQGEDALLPGLLYTVLPNVILIPLFLDQVLYPLLFVLGAGLTLVAVQRRSFWIAVLAGTYIYLLVFMTFSLLAVGPLFAIWIAVAVYRRCKNERLSLWKGIRATRAIQLLLGASVGLLVMFLVFRIFLGYDPITRYNKAMDVHRQFDFVERIHGSKTAGVADQTLRIGPAQVLRAAFLNNLEFAAAVGFPIFLLFLVYSLRLLITFLNGHPTLKEEAFGALLATFIALNLFGQTQGEVSRLWLAWAPMMVLFASSELSHLYRRRTLAFSFLVVLQLVTILLTFHFQDFVSSSFD
jgi:hypothetical protein